MADPEKPPPPLPTSISHFEFNGLGKLSYVTKTAPLLELVLQSTTLKPFSAQYENEQAPFWKPSSHSGNSFAKISSRGSTAKSYLISPKFINTEQKELELVIKEIARNPLWENQKVFISTDYESGEFSSASSSAVFPNVVSRFRLRISAAALLQICRR